MEVKFSSQAKPYSSFPIGYAEKGTLGPGSSSKNDGTPELVRSAREIADQIRSMDNVEGLDLDPRPGPVELSPEGLQRLKGKQPFVAARLHNLDSKTQVFETVTHEQSSYGAIQGGRCGVAVVPHYGGPEVPNAIDVMYLYGHDTGTGKSESFSGFAL